SVLNSHRLSYREGLVHGGNFSVVKNRVRRQRVGDIRGRAALEHGRQKQREYLERGDFRFHHRPPIFPDCTAAEADRQTESAPADPWLARLRPSGYRV